MTTLYMYNPSSSGVGVVGKKILRKNQSNPAISGKKYLEKKPNKTKPVKIFFGKKNHTKANQTKPNQQIFSLKQKPSKTKKKYRYADPWSSSLAIFSIEKSH